MTRKQRIQHDLEEIVRQLEPGDLRANLVPSKMGHDQVAQFLESVIVSESLSEPIAKLALPLACLFATPRLPVAALRILRERPDLASWAASALARLRDPAIIP